jgi:hypothetical protein
MPRVEDVMVLTTVSFGTETRLAVNAPLTPNIRTLNVMDWPA